LLLLAFAVPAPGWVLWLAKPLASLCAPARLVRSAGNLRSCAQCFAPARFRKYFLKEKSFFIYRTKDSTRNRDFHLQNMFLFQKNDKNA
jgi:hypothetical protein